MTPSRSDRELLEEVLSTVRLGANQLKPLQSVEVQSYDLAFRGVGYSLIKLAGLNGDVRFANEDNDVSATIVLKLNPRDPMKKTFYPFRIPYGLSAFAVLDRVAGELERVTERTDIRALVPRVRA